MFSLAIMLVGYNGRKLCSSCCCSLQPHQHPVASQHRYHPRRIHITLTSPSSPTPPEPHRLCSDLAFANNVSIPIYRARATPTSLVVIRTFQPC
jgi:hypothetical protein